MFRRQCSELKPVKYEHSVRVSPKSVYDTRIAQPTQTATDPKKITSFVKYFLEVLIEPKEATGPSTLFTPSTVN